MRFLTSDTPNSGRLRTLLGQFDTPAGRGGILVGAGVAIAALAAGLISTLLAGVLGSAEFGRYALAVTTVSVLAIVTGLGLGPILIREIARYAKSPGAAHKTRTVLGVVATVFVASTAVALVLATVGGQWIGAEMTAMGGQTAWLMALLLIGMSANVIQAEAFRGLKRFGLAAFGGPTLWRLLTLAAIGVLLLAPAIEITARDALTVTAIAAVAAAVISFVALGRVLRPSSEDLLAIRWQPHLVRLGLPILGVGLLGFVLVRLPVWVLGLQLGVAEVGVYAFALSVATLVGMVTPVINGTIAPFASSLLEASNLDRLQLRARQAANLGGGAVALTTIPVLVLEYVVIQWFLGPDYESATVVTLILLGGVLARTASGPSAVILNLSGNQTWTMLASASGLAAAVILIFPATAFGGVVGAALAVTGAQILQQTMLVVFVKQRLGIRTYVDLRPAR